MEFKNYNPVEGEEAMSGIVVVGLLINCRGDAGVSSGEAGLEGDFEGEGIGEGKFTTGLEGKSKRDGVKDGKSSSGSEKTEKQSSQGEKLSAVRCKKRN